MSILDPVQTLPPTAPPATEAASPLEHHRLSARQPGPQWPRRFIAALVIVTALLTFSYTGFALYGAPLVHQNPPLPITQTPRDLGLAYHDVTFPSRDDHLTLQGWFIPGVLADGRLTAERTIVFVHGNDGNRAASDNDLLGLSAAFAQHGFGVLAFDLRGQGASAQLAPAVVTWGVLEQRDVLGAVDFLRRGPLPYPELRRPRIIGAWGLSLGAASILFAAVHEPAIAAIVSDTAYADILPILEREIPKQGNAPSFVTPGVLLAAGLINGVNYYDIRPVDVVASLAPRPLFFIHGDHDDFTPPSDMDQLVAAARSAPNAHVESWLVPAVYWHGYAFRVARSEYVTHVVTFFNGTLGSPTQTP